MLMFAPHNFCWLQGQIFAGKVSLVTMGQDSVHSCLELACHEEDQATERCAEVSEDRNQRFLSFWRGKTTCLSMVSILLELFR